MNIKLKTTKLKSLTKNHNSIGKNMTPHVAGGSSRPGGGGGSYEPTMPTNCEIDLCHTAPEPGMACNITGTSPY
ncbi:hypothetical protein L1077_03100 [Pseudoalteromonas luteoviolacea]|uniref:hypothetical protein n=1 Tax=Pseudoalteromonas luteoviolacea TaxID=43657 RepID=UPI001F391025|nr:hypothetical protein [Pseudoalteromonas luteoviolacea]MCF6438417.1 hypothetical protein [Pseudoalteromonas luteoviolacea]